MKRFMRIDYKENGVPMVLDRRNNEIIPEAQIASHGDSTDFAKTWPEIQQQLKENIIVAEKGHVEPGPEKYMHKPEEVLAKSREILRQIRLPQSPGLSVGDLSVVTAEKREQDIEWLQKKANQDAIAEGRPTVGDLSVCGRRVEPN